MRGVHPVLFDDLPAGCKGWLRDGRSAETIRTAGANRLVGVRLRDAAAGPGPAARPQPGSVVADPLPPQLVSILPSVEAENWRLKDGVPWSVPVVARDR